MKSLLRSLTVLVVITIGIGIPNSLQAQLPNGLETRYKVERVLIPEPIFEEVRTVHEIRTNFSDPGNPYAVAVGVFTRGENDRYGHGYIYDHFGTINPSEPKQFYALDQLPGTTYPPAWAGPNFTESKCFGLNSSGIVTGYLADPVTAEHLAFYLDINDPNLEIKEIPRPGGREPTDNWFAGRRVTETGEILVRYTDNIDGRNNQFVFEPTNGNSIPIPVRFIEPPTINSLGDLVGRTYSDPEYFIKRYNYLTGITEDVPNDSLWSSLVANDIGQFAGRRWVRDRRGRYRGENGDYVTRYGSNLAVEYDSRARAVYSLNLSGDFTLDRSSTGFDPLPNEVFVYQDEWGELNLMDLVPDADPQNSNDPSDILANAQFLDDPRLSNRDTTGLGWLACAGMAAGAEFEQELFILIPYVPEPSPGVSVSPATGLTTTEAPGDTDSFTVVLDTQPIADVTIGISTSDNTEGMIDDPVLGLVELTSLTFTPANWDIPQTVAVRGVDDSEIDGNMPYEIVTTADTNTIDPDYYGMNPVDVGVTNLDNEQAPSVTYDSDVPENDVAILDLGTATSTITVPDVYQVADVNVTLTIDHDRVQDLDVYLIGPDGTTVQLFTDVGGNGVNFSGTTLDDETGTSITAGSAPFSGSYFPEGNLGAFDGKDTVGDWTLEVTDDKRNRTGTIRNWSITFETN